MGLFCLGGSIQYNHFFNLAFWVRKDVNTWRSLMAGTFMGFGAIVAAGGNYGLFNTFFGFNDPTFMSPRRFRNLGGDTSFSTALRTEYLPIYKTYFNGN